MAVFPQCYAAVVDKIPAMAKKTLIVDIGSWTIDIMPVINKSPDESKCVTIPKGLITCILSNAASMMLIHCHPSGNVFPSKADTMMTDRMNKLCELMGIPLIDHIIVGGDNREFFSFKEKGMIDNPKITLSTDYRTLDIKSPLVAEQGKAR